MLTHLPTALTALQSVRNSSRVYDAHAKQRIVFGIQCLNTKCMEPHCSTEGSVINCQDLSQDGNFSDFQQTWHMNLSSLCQKLPSGSAGLSETSAHLQLLHKRRDGVVYEMSLLCTGRSSQFSNGGDSRVLWSHR